jgi:uncharacterized protein (DUF2267 family)
MVIFAVPQEKLSQFKSRFQNLIWPIREECTSCNKSYNKEVLSMDSQDMITRVQELAAVETADQAQGVVCAVLETLGERLSKAERENCAAQLPQDLKDYLLKRPNTQGFTCEEVYNRVRARADVGFPDAVKGTRAVMHVLQEAISPGEMKDLFAELPSDYRNLLASPSSEAI